MKYRGLIRTQRYGGRGRNMRRSIHTLIVQQGPRQSSSCQFVTVEVVKSFGALPFLYRNLACLLFVITDVCTTPSSYDHWLNVYAPLTTGRPISVFLCFSLLTIVTCVIFLIITDVFLFYVHFLPILV